MSALCLRRFICEATKKDSSPLFRYFSHLVTQNITSRTLLCPRLTIAFARRGPVTLHANSLCTTVEEGEDEPETKKRKQDPNARKTFGSIGRKIPHRIIQVIDDNGQNLGNMHRADVIRIMDERGLKLVLLGENADPPVYRLMTGKQIHEEQLRLKEKQKASPKAGTVEIKELRFSAGIAKHDLATKTKQIDQWIEKKHHVRITVQQRGRSVDGADKLVILEQIVESMAGRAACVYKPKLVKEGKAAMCVLRPPSEKELREHKKGHTEEREGGGVSKNEESGQAETPRPNELPQ